jgi:predicted Zn-dependent protease
MWGGSQQELDVIARDAQAHAAGNPRLVALLATAGGYEGMMRWRDDDDRQAVRLYEAALAHGPDDMYLDQARRALANIGDRVRAIEVMSQLTRFDFGNSWVRVERAKALVALKEHEWALAEFEAMAAAGGTDSLPFMHDYVWALMQTGKYADAESRLQTLLAANPSDRRANRVLAELYLYRLRNLEQAAVHIDALLAAEPDDGAALLLRTDLLQNRNAPQEEIRAAAEKFVQHADPDDEAQAAALPKVQAWLASGG